MHDEAEGESNQHQHDGAEKRRHKATDVKSGNECAGQQQDDGIDHQEEESQSKNAKREGQEFQEKSQGCVQEADDQGRDQRATEPGELKARHDISADEQRNGTEQPNEK